MGILDYPTNILGSPVRYDNPSSASSASSPLSIEFGDFRSSYTHDIKIIETCLMVIPKRTHKRKRINKKYLKKYGSIPSPNIMQTPMGLICHPVTANELRRKLRSQ